MRKTNLRILDIDIEIEIVNQFRLSRFFLEFGNSMRVGKCGCNTLIS
jgi:hypothetical protein